MQGSIRAAFLAMTGCRSTVEYLADEERTGEAYIRIVSTFLADYTKAMAKLEKTSCAAKKKRR